MEGRNLYGISHHSTYCSDGLEYDGQSKLFVRMHVELGTTYFAGSGGFQGRVQGTIL